MTLAAFYLLATGCRKSPAAEAAEQQQQATTVLITYNGILLDLVKGCEGYRPPVSARMYAYMGLAAWETSRPALPAARSMTSLCPGIKVPVWDTVGGPFVLPVALDACYRTLIEHFFPHRIQYLSKQSEAQLHAMLTGNSQRIGPVAIERSRRFGEAMAMAFYTWSATDSIGHQAYLYNFDKGYAPPVGPGLWTKTGVNPAPALLPRWGQVRTFVVAPGEVRERAPKPFSEDPGSPFYAEAMELYTLSRPLSNEDRWIAEFWSDDFSGVCFCASSRWVSIANQALELKKADFPTAIETYLKLGLALNDAAVKAWQVKYEFDVERPETYIQRNITNNWEPLHDSPPFPSYPSGHATFSAASAAVFSSILGDEIEMSDRSHEGRKEFLSKPRRFHSFHEMARENAVSRLLLGVHYRMDCEEGYRLGEIIGGRVAAMEVWERPHKVKN